VGHKQIGLLHIGHALVFLLIGGFEAVLMRIQLAVPNGTRLRRFFCPLYGISRRKRRKYAMSSNGWKNMIRTRHPAWGRLRLIIEEAAGRRGASCLI
jgi:hypothetical protein